MPETPVDPPSFWLADVGEPLVPRPPLEGEATVDVAIVGAGYTGLWTAWYLATRDPALRVALVESQVAGFGAAGRNGGWCSCHLSGIESWLAGSRREGGLALQRAMFDAVDEVGRVAGQAGIACDYRKGGFLTVALSDVESERIRALVAGVHRYGLTEEDFRFLDAAGCDAHVRLRGTRGGLFSPHAAVVQPAKLARGLARALEERGVTLFERSPARRLAAGEVVTDRGVLRARTVLRCTEAWTRDLPESRRELLPLHSMMLATEPLPASFWKDVGADTRPAFGDVRRILSYAQRTADDRIALGAGGLYLWDSGVRSWFPPSGPDYRHAERALFELFPQLEGVRITHRWGGPMGVPRDFRPFVRFDPATGLGAAGGYVGNGVAAANLAGRTLADLVAGRDTERTRYPWVQHRARGWEPEPLRWLSVRGMLALGASTDRAETRGNAARLRAAFFQAFAGH